MEDLTIPATYERFGDQPISGVVAHPESLTGPWLRRPGWFAVGLGTVVVLVAPNVETAVDAATRHVYTAISLVSAAGMLGAAGWSLVAALVLLVGLIRAMRSVAAFSAGRRRWLAANPAILQPPEFGKYLIDLSAYEVTSVGLAQQRSDVRRGLVFLLSAGISALGIYLSLDATHTGERIALLAVGVAGALTALAQVAVLGALVLPAARTMRVLRRDEKAVRSWYAGTYGEAELRRAGRSGYVRFLTRPQVWIGLAAIVGLEVVRRLVT